MNFGIHHIKELVQLKLLFVCLGLVLLASSCNLFENEFKQDKQLAFYRFQVHRISDSITTNTGRIDAYKAVIEKASDDNLLFTPRKKNTLLSEVYDILSSEYYEVKQVDNAIANSTLAIVLNEANQQAYYNRACIYQSIGKDSLAIIDYTKSLMYNDKYVDSYYNRGIIYEKQTDFQLAIEDYSKAINLSPVYLVDVYNNRGNVYQEMNFLDKAISDYDKALKIDSTLAITYCNRADTYMKKGDVDKAIRDYKKAFQADSTNLVIVDKIENIVKEKKRGKLALAE